MTVVSTLTLPLHADTHRNAVSTAPPSSALEVSRKGVLETTVSAGDVQVEGPRLEIRSVYLH